MIARIAILGPGLLGGSLALALRARRAAAVSLWARRPEAIEEINAIALADYASTSLPRVVRDADLIVLCTPVGAMTALAREIAGVLKPGAIVTDVGSVKAGVCAELAPIFHAHGARFIGSHPMAGSDQTGLRAARATLFEGSVCMITPAGDSDPGAVAVVQAFWETLGCTVRLLAPEAHDEVVAMVSHFPHLLAATLVNTVAGRDEGALDLCGPGFRDTTRVAAGAPAMWAEILASNHAAVLKTIEAMIESLREIANILARDPADPAILAFLTSAKQRRDRLRPPQSPNV